MILHRLRIILIPVVPNAGRNVSKYLAALFDNYDGNVEVNMSLPILSNDFSHLKIRIIINLKWYFPEMAFHL